MKLIFWLLAIGYWLLGNCSQPIANIKFTDVISEMGIDFVHQDGRSGRFYFVEQLGSGVAFFDYDGDQDLDLYFVNGAHLSEKNYPEPPKNRLYENRGDHFADVTHLAKVGDLGYGVGCCVGDYDNDGDLDLHITNFGNNVLYKNNGDRTFTNVTDQAKIGDQNWGASSAFGDYDNDGDLDLYVTNYLIYNRENHKTCRINGIETYCKPQDFPAQSDRLFRNNGDLTFTNVTDLAGVNRSRGRGLGVAWGDYDDDGDLDLYVANDTNENYLFKNRGDGTFDDHAFFAGVALSENGEMESGMGVDFSDFDNDGDLDLMVTNFQGETATLYRNDSNGFFTDVSFVSGTGERTLTTLGWAISFFDFDNDGDKDLFIANGHIYSNIDQFSSESTYDQPNHLFENLGDGTFREISEKVGDDFQIRRSSRGAAIGDFDNDGDLDLVITNSNDRPQLLRNDGGNLKNWMQIDLIGKSSAIGAKVQVTAGDLTQMEIVKSGSGYLSQSSLTLHFGLGDRDLVDEIVVRFPSGVVRRIEKIKVNQRISVSEK